MAYDDGQKFYDGNVQRHTKEIDWSKVPDVEIDPERQSGAPVFAGTRIPLNVVINNIHHGGTKEEVALILENFDVTLDQVKLILRELKRPDRRPLVSTRPN